MMQLFQRFILASFVFCTASASGAVRTFRIHSFKQVTPQVDRLYGQDGGAFATMFCRADAAEVMFVDARVPDLDGVSFVFSSIEACVQARETIRESYRKCVAVLELETDSKSADISVSKCK